MISYPEVIPEFVLRQTWNDRLRNGWIGCLANERARLLMTQPGVGPITSLAFVIAMGDVTRFPSGKQVSSYLELIPSEHSSSKRRQRGTDRQTRQPLPSHAAGGERADGVSPG
jgi:transposase